MLGVKLSGCCNGCLFFVAIHDLLTYGVFGVGCCSVHARPGPFYSCWVEVLGRVDDGFVEHGFSELGAVVAVQQLPAMLDILLRVQVVVVDGLV